MIKLNYAPRFTVGVMIFVLINCVFWAYMDVYVFGVKDGHTIYYIYLPVGSMFLFALRSWRSRSPLGLMITQRFCEVITVGLFGYGSYLLTTQPIWGVVTYAFSPLFVYVRWGCRLHSEHSPTRPSQV